jgi:predicted RNA-binding protein with PIN domain
LVLTELKPAIELAFHYARSRARSSDPSDVPPELRPLLKLSKLPPSGYSIVRDAINEHDSFRELVAAQVTAADVGELAFAWLQSDEGSAEVIATLEGAMAAELSSQTSKAIGAKVREVTARADAQRSALQRAADVSEKAARESGAALHRSEEENRRLRMKVEQVAGEREELAQRIPYLEERARNAEAALGEERTRVKAAGVKAAGVEATRADEGASAPDMNPKQDEHRRTPVRNRTGLADDSPEGLRGLFAMAGLRVFIDGYNVAMLGWPQLDLGAQRARLVHGLSHLLVSSLLTVDIVFDGADIVANDRLSRSSNVRVDWSPAGVTADDVIVERIRQIAVATVVVVITDDRDVRRRVGDLGCNVGGSRALLDLIAARR